MDTFPALPTPDPAALAHSQRLAKIISEAIRSAGGSLDFQRYMDLALYAPALGYYHSGLNKIGAGGDFVTAPELSSLFARSLARQCQEILRPGDAILELGAGTGIMASTLLAELEALDALPEHYAILELSGELRQRQQRLLATRLPHLQDRIHWLEALPDGFQGVIIANEVLDALPVSRFRLTDAGPRPLTVVEEQTQRFNWQVGAPCKTLEATLNALELTVPLPVGYESEFSPTLQPWIRSLADSLDRGAILLIDYGYPRQEYYHPQRNRGTLLCHYRHRVHDDPFLWPGLQDITTSVDFTAVAEAALDADLTVAGYTSQGSFLLGCGLTELLQAANPGPRADYLKLAREAKILTLPGEMGERFQVMLLTRGLSGPFRGFQRDDRGRL